MKRKYLPALLYGAVVYLGCIHKPFKAATPAPVVVVPVCDTINVSYSAVIKPLLQANCYECHATAVTANGGLDLEDFTSLKNYLTLGFRGDGVYGSKLYHCALHSTNALPMPPVYKLDSCSMSKLACWLRAGGRDN